MNKDSWEVKKLGDIATYINGYSFKPSDWEDDGLPIIRIQNLNSSEAPYNYTTKRIDKKYVVNFGEILISWSASLGVYEWKGTSALLNQHIFKVQFDKIEINKFFFKYQVDRQIEEMLQHIHGATMKHITKKNFDNIRFLVPPPPIQEQIVKELDALSDIITKKKEQLAELDKLAQATFYDMFGDPVENEKNWELKKLDEICTKITDGTHTSPKFLEKGIPFLFVSNIQNNELNFNTQKYISTEEYERLTRNTKIEQWDLLYTSVGSFGNPAIIKTNEKFCFQRHIAHLKPKHKIINIIFFHAVMKIDYVKHQANRLAIGVAQKTLNLSAIKKIVIPNPPISLQNQFAEKIEAIEQQKALINQSITDTQLLFDYTMDKYFN